MSFLRLRCTAPENRGWTAWLPAVVLLIVITMQLIDRASERSDSGVESADPPVVIGDER